MSGARAGVALVAALLVVAALATLTLAALLETRLELAATRRQALAAQARASARSCLRLAVAVADRGGPPRAGAAGIPGCELRVARPDAERLELHARVVVAEAADDLAASYLLDPATGRYRLLGFR